MVKTSDKMQFKYRNSYLFDILSYLFIILFLLVSFLVFDKVESNLWKLLIIVFFLIILLTWMYFVKKKLDVVVGEIDFDKNNFSYTTLGKTYYLYYKEIEYIMKDFYIDDGFFFERTNILYKVKVKDAGIFTFKYYDNNIDDVIGLLAKKCKLEIIDKTN